MSVRGEVPDGLEKGGLQALDGLVDALPGNGRKRGTGCVTAGADGFAEAAQSGPERLDLPAIAAARSAIEDMKAEGPALGPRQALVE